MTHRGKTGIINKEPRNELPAGEVPDCLVWELIKKNNAYIFKSGHETFTKERYNLMARHTPMYSGLMQKSVMNLELSPSGSKIVLTSMDLQNARQPRNKTQTKNLDKNPARVEFLKNFAYPSRPELAEILAEKFIKMTHAKLDENVE
uniref:Ribosomal eL28/Mak16 domain-containing protein n=1 Tax=Babesia bovis TaxID=5865 RepID=S6C8Y4_BABBO|nr:conserved hypothetical protein [Babesia bovis]